MGATALPAALSLAVAHAVSPVTAVAVLAFLPFLTELCSHLRSAASSATHSPRLAQALAGVMGLLLLLPATLPVSPSGWAALATLVFATMLTAATLAPAHRALQKHPSSVALSGAALAQAATYALAAVLFRAGPVTLHEDASPFAAALLATLIDVGWLVLLREISPVRLASRTLLTPLVGIAELAIFSHAPLSTRMLFGTLLALGGAVLLWRTPPAETPLSLR